MQMQMRLLLLMTAEARRNACATVDDAVGEADATPRGLVQAKGIARRCCGCCRRAVVVLMRGRERGQGEEMWRRTREWL